MYGNNMHREGTNIYLIT